MTSFQKLYECDLSRIKPNSKKWDMETIHFCNALMQVSSFAPVDPPRLSALGELGVNLLRFALENKAIMRMWVDPLRRTAGVEVVGDSLRLTTDCMTMPVQIVRAGNGGLSVTEAEGLLQPQVALVAQFPLTGAMASDEYL